jgi:hypothetical protein
MDIFYFFTFQKQQTILQHIPSPVELAQDIQEDFLGFSEEDCVG